MSTKNTCMMVVSLVFTLLSLFVAEQGIELAFGDATLNAAKVIICSASVMHVAVSALVLYALLASESMWTAFVPCLRTGFYTILAILALLFVAEIAFLIYILSQKISETYVLFLVFDGYAMLGTAILAGVYCGILIPLFKLYDASTKMAYEPVGMYPAMPVRWE